MTKLELNHEQLKLAIINGLAAMSVRLWHLEINRISEGFEFIVYIDADAVTADLCADVARHLLAVLGAEGLAQEQVFIDVSSPGLARRLYSIEHCQLYIGQKVRCSFAKEGYLIGELTAVEDELITLNIANNGQLKVNFSELEQINLQENLS